MRPAPFATLFATALLTASFGAWPGPSPKGVVAGHVVLGPSALRFGRSVGSPTDGRLLGGAHLEASPALRICPAYFAQDVRWGIQPLVSMIERSAKLVRRQFPESVMNVGHLSRQGGGEIDRHVSHETGRDADIGFYIRTQTNKPLLADHFVSFRADGSAPTWPGARFDDARNWALVASLLNDSQARISYIFVSTALRSRLLGYAEKVGAPIALRLRAAEVMVQPRGSLPHDDHFHVRVGCPSGMSSCIEYPTPRNHLVAASSRDGTSGRGRGPLRNVPAVRSPNVRTPASAPVRKPAAAVPSPVSPDGERTVSSESTAVDDFASPPASMMVPYRSDDDVPDGT